MTHMTLSTIGQLLCGVALVSPSPLHHNPPLPLKQKPATTQQPYHHHTVPSFALNELVDGRHPPNDDHLRRILVTTGILSVQVPAPPPPHDEPPLSLTGLCQCQDQFATGEFVLDDGITTRYTLATAIEGRRSPAPPLPQARDIASACGPDVLAAMERARRAVSTAVEAFLPALDRLLRQPDGSGSSGGLMRTEDGEEYGAVEEIVGDAVNLEHFHVYSKDSRTAEGGGGVGSEEEEGQYTLEWHTDGGIFLAFLPAQSCSSTSPYDSSFLLRHSDASSDGPPLRALFQPPTPNATTIGILLGRGAERWLDTPLALRATHHAVEMQPGQRRVWYGRMHTVPHRALLPSGDNDGGGSSIPFSQWRRHLGENGDGGAGKKVHQRRRLPDDHAHAEGPEECSNENDFFCWVSCLDAPSTGKTLKSHLEEGKSLYCLDPSVLDDTQSVELAVEACTDGNTGLVGATLNTDCQNTWQETVVGVTSYTDGLLMKLVGDDGAGTSSPVTSTSSVDSPVVPPVASPVVSSVEDSEDGGDHDDHSYHSEGDESHGSSAFRLGAGSLILASVMFIVLLL